MSYQMSVALDYYRAATKVLIAALAQPNHAGFCERIAICQLCNQQSQAYTLALEYVGVAETVLRGPDASQST